MHQEVVQLMSASDGAIVSQRVTEYAKVDFDGLVAYANHFKSTGNWKSLVEVQHRIIEAMAKTLVHLAKQNALMDQDYKRGKT